MADLDIFKAGFDRSAESETKPQSTTDPELPETIAVRICRCGAIETGTNACAYCGAGWAQVKVPLTTFYRTPPATTPVVDNAWKVAVEIANNRLGPRSDAPQFWDKYAAYVKGVVEHHFAAAATAVEQSDSKDVERCGRCKQDYNFLTQRIACPHDDRPRPLRIKPC